MKEGARSHLTGPAANRNLSDDLPLDALEFRVHGVKVHALQPNQAVTFMTDRLKPGKNGKRRFRYLVSTNINNIVCAIESEVYAKVMECADISVPDGIPLIWIGRALGRYLPSRCGIEEVMLAIFELSSKGHNYSHYFYGNTEEVLDQLRINLTTKYPNINIVGMRSPPFRLLTDEENDHDIDLINRAAPDFLWVSLGCPRQESWLFNNRDRLNAGFGGGAGAVFNFLSGHSPQPPHWLRMAGLEWSFRLVSEPLRLWRRYLVRYPKFFYYFIHLPK